MLLLSGELLVELLMLSERHCLLWWTTMPYEVRSDSDELSCTREILIKSRRVRQHIDVNLPVSPEVA